MNLEDDLFWVPKWSGALPERLQHKVGTVYRHLPASWKWGKEYPPFQRLAAEGEQWSPDEIQAYQLKELRRTLHHAASYCRFYQRSFTQARFRPETVHSFADLRDCPLLGKKELVEHLPDIVSSDVPPSKRLFFTTGDSTGVPIGLFLQKGVSRPREQAFLETIWRRARYFEGARLAVIPGPLGSSKDEGRIASYDPTRDWLILSPQQMTDERLPEYLETLEGFKPDLLHVQPAAALQLAEFLEKFGQSWRTPLRAVLCGSARLTLPQKRMLERVFGCRVFRWYGQSERVVLAAEGTQSELFYFLPYYGFVEFGAPDAEGLREVIGTSFHNMAMPLVRYRTGDYVRVVEASVARPGATSMSSEQPLEYAWPAAVEIVEQAGESLA